MRDDPYIPGKSQISHEILAYLAEHPDAQDTLEGIVQWWLLERKITYQTAMVKEALAELIEKGLIIKNETQKVHPHYRLNPHRREEVLHLLNGEIENTTGSQKKGSKSP